MQRPLPIRSVAVLGAGTMGAQIAAHCANAGLQVVLLDLTADGARDGLKKAAALKPDPLFTKDVQAAISLGGFDTDLGHVAGADWIVEAIVEKLAIKQALFERIEQVRTPGSIVSSNTSGIPIAALAEGRSDDFRRHFLGTHFFNPPRYLRLVEIIPTPDTEAGVVERIAWCADHRLGKGVVVAKDSPGFVANRIGLFGVGLAIRELAAGRYTVEEIDAITGPALGRPKSATFRTMDIAGLDIVAHVNADFVARLPDPASQSAYTLPPLVGAMVERRMIGEKSGQGFYKRNGSEILGLDPATLTYRPREAVRIPSIESTAALPTTERVRALFVAQDKAGEFLRATLAPLLIYTADIALSIAGSIDDIDRAMQWGFGWELGPFELWDAIGIQTVLEAAGAPAPAMIEGLREEGRQTFRDRPIPPAARGLQLLKSAKDRTPIVQRNPGASLVDLGDGVLAVELHSKMNAIGNDTVQMLQAGVREAARHFVGLVVCSDSNDFSAGANLMLLLLEAQDGNWDEIELMVRSFQQTTMALRDADVPVVVAPCGLTLGGGAEIAMHGARTQAAAESYIGLVEVGVGLIPAGGGLKEMMQRATDAQAGVPADPLKAAQSVFETVGFAKVSTSAAHARQLGYLRDEDGVTMNRERLVSEAKAAVLALARDGYQRPTARPIPVGGETVEAALKLGVHLAHKAGRISEHDVTIGRLLAHVVAGGSLPHATTISETRMLDLEREAFLKLCGERKTLERIQHTLKTGKPLRN